VRNTEELREVLRELRTLILRGEKERAAKHCGEIIHEIEVAERLDGRLRGPP
jgi:hypothetical protein